MPVGGVFGPLGVLAMVVPQQSALWALVFWLLVAQNVTVI